MRNSTYSQDLRLLLPETIWLEPEHFSLARKICSSDTAKFGDSWQTFLNTLALLAFEEWLKERLPNKVISRDTSSIQAAGNLTIDSFKFCAIAIEHLLDEFVSIPQAVVQKPELTAHFYVVLEVLEEQEEVIVKGFLSYKQLIEMKSNFKLSVDEGCYQLPLSAFDMEPSHLLVYQRYVQASEFALPAVENKVNQASTTTTKLSNWLQGTIDEAWLTIDAISNPKLNLAFSTRNVDTATKKAKIIDLGIDLGNRKVVLLVNISPEKTIDSKNGSSEEKINVLAQLYPMGGEKFLPQNIKLFLVSKAGKILQEVTSRTQDNYTQLKPFKGKTGKKFSIQISLGDMVVKESFEL
ncbi:hypothetical protein NIES267_54530 [Calothrix parasitica NIES-267]|uniref:DUF1822 family protein n=1 Tax=Calothrix parasitica NIES-267 TaxID=1973488 RepID=A0A1Z4LXG5_9CYAN|nr:hypothetical protein NIES267_54530 [Calothrix parasitica NIES-267]